MDDHDNRQPVPEPLRRSSGAERFDVPGAEILAHDTWAEEPEPCPNCGAEVHALDTSCPECGAWLPRCWGSCASCGSPVCVGGKRR